MVREAGLSVPRRACLSRGGPVHPLHHKSTRLTQFNSGPCVVKKWSSYVQILNQRNLRTPPCGPAQVLIMQDLRRLQGYLTKLPTGVPHRLQGRLTQGTTGVPHSGAGGEDEVLDDVGGADCQLAQNINSGTRQQLKMPSWRAQISTNPYDKTKSTNLTLSQKLIFAPNWDFLSCRQPSRAVCQQESESWDWSIWSNREGWWMPRQS